MYSRGRGVLEDVLQSACAIMADLEIIEMGHISSGGAGNRTNTRGSGILKIGPPFCSPKTVRKGRGNDTVIIGSQKNKTQDLFEQSLLCI